MTNIDPEDADVIVRGEVHLSTADGHDLLETHADNADILFIEGRDNPPLDEHPDTAWYWIFWIAAKLYTIMLDRGLSLWSLISQSRDIRSAARERGLVVDTDIDSTLPEMWSALPQWARPLPGVIAGLAVPFLLVYWWVVLSGTGSLLYAIPLTLASPMAVMIPVPLTNGRRGSRDQRMADTIVERMAAEEDGRALVLVGQYHVEPVAKELQKRGLSAATESTQSLSGQVTSAVTKLIKLLLRPVWALSG